MTETKLYYKNENIFNNSTQSYSSFILFLLRRMLIQTFTTEILSQLKGKNKTETENK